MPDISKITLPSGTTYDIKDSVAREAISGGVTFIICTAASNTPSGISITRGGSTWTGTLAADNAQIGAFYLAYSGTQTSGDLYDEYVPVMEAGAAHKTWEKIGDTRIVGLNKTTTSVLKSLGSPSTDVALGENATFTTTVTPATTKIKASVSTSNINLHGALSGGSLKANGTTTVLADKGTFSTDSFVTSVSADNTKKLVTDSVIGVGSSTTTASKATAITGKMAVTGFSHDASGNNNNLLQGISISGETLSIGSASLTADGALYSFSDVTVPIKNSAATVVATGAVDKFGLGAAVTTGVTVGETKSAVTGYETDPTSVAGVWKAAQFNALPSVSLSSATTAGAGDISVANGISSASLSTGSTGDVTIATGITSATTTTNAKDAVTAVTGYSNTSSTTVLSDVSLQEQ